MPLPPAPSPEVSKPSQRQSSRITKKPDRLGIDSTSSIQSISEMSNEEELAISLIEFAELGIWDQSVIGDHQQEEEGKDDIASNWT